MNDDGWNSVLFKDLVEFHDQRRIPLSKKERVGRSGPFPYYGAQGIIDWVDDYIFDGPFLLIAEDGENLRSRKQPIAFMADGQFWVNNHAHVVRARKGMADNDFLRAFLEFHPLSGLITGAAQPKLSQASLKRLPVTAPPYAVQARIGEAVRVVDGLIRNNWQRIEILEEMARLLYREWFVNFRFPGHEDIELVDSDLGPIPEGWSACRLGELLELSYGKALRSDDRRGGSNAVYGSGGQVGWHDKALVSGPGIVVGRKGNVGSVYWSDRDFFPIDTTYYVESALPLRFLDQLLRTLKFIDSHAAVPGLSRDQAYGLVVAKPTSDLMSRYETAVRPMYSLRRVLSDQATILREARDLVLPRLVSGELEVSELGLELEAAGA